MRIPAKSRFDLVDWIYIRTPQSDLEYAGRVAAGQGGEDNPKHGRGSPGSHAPNTAYLVGNRAELAAGRMFGLVADIEGGRGHNDITTTSGLNIEVKGTLYKDGNLQFNARSELNDPYAMLVYLRTSEWAMVMGWVTRDNYYQGRTKWTMPNSGWLWRYSKNTLRRTGDILKAELQRGGSVGDIQKCDLCGAYVVGDAEICPQHKRSTYSRRQPGLFDEDDPG